MDALMFQAEVKRVEKLLFRIAWSYLPQEQDTEDAVQDALILARQCLNVLRKRRRYSFFPLEEDAVSFEMPEPVSPLQEAMNGLKPDLRLAVTLHYVDGYTVQQIADALGIPVGTVQTRLHRARKHLKKSLLIEWEESL